MGALIGLVNGLLIVKVGVPDLLATLSTMFLLAGLQLIPTGGRSITAGMMLPDGSTAKGAYDPAFLILGRSACSTSSPPVVVMAIVAVLAWFLMERTRFGRVFYAIGGNETAAHLAGAPTKAYRLWAYVISGTLASLGGLIIASRVGRGDVSAGNSLLLDAVAASLIGFAVLDKRRPHVLGTVLGAIFVGVLLNGLTMLNAPYYTQDFVKGAVLVGALALTFGLGSGSGERPCERRLMLPPPNDVPELDVAADLDADAVDGIDEALAEDVADPLVAVVIGLEVGLFDRVAWLPRRIGGLSLRRCKTAASKLESIRRKRVACGQGRGEETG